MVYLLVDAVNVVARIFSVLVIARALLSWFSPDPRNPIVQLVVRLTEPVMAPVRNLLPSAGGIDFSPLIVLIGVQVLQQVLVRLIYSMA